MRVYKQINIWSGVPNICHGLGILGLSLWPSCGNFEANAIFLEMSPSGAENVLKANFAVFGDFDESENLP